MKDGSKLNGTILDEDETHYTARIAIKPTIFENKKLAKADVEKIIPEAADLEDYQALKPLKTPGDLSQASDYDSQLAKLNNFIKKHPDSSHLEEIKAHKAELEAEKSKLEAGQIKIDGTWLSGDDILRRQIEIDSKLLLKEMRDHYRQGFMISALRSFHAQAPQFESTETFKEILDLAGKSMIRYDAYLNKEIPAAKERIEKRDRGMAGLSQTDRERLKNLMKEEESKFAELAAKDEEDGQIWLNLSAYDSDGLEDAQQLIKRQQQRLEQLNNRCQQEAEKPSAEAVFASFWKAIDDKDDRAANEAKNTLSSMRLDEKYLQPVESALEGLKEQLAAEQEAESKKAEADAAKAEEKKADDPEEAEPKTKA